MGWYCALPAFPSLGMGEVLIVVERETVDPGGREVLDPASPSSEMEGEDQALQLDWRKGTAKP